MSDQNFNNTNEEEFNEEDIRYEKISDDELQVICGGKMSSAWDVPLSILEKESRRKSTCVTINFRKGDDVLYTDRAGKQHPATITDIKWHGSQVVVEVYIKDEQISVETDPYWIRKV